MSTTKSKAPWTCHCPFCKRQIGGSNYAGLIWNLSVHVRQQHGAVSKKGGSNATH